MTSTASFQDVLATRTTGTSGSHQRVKPDDFLRIEIVVPRDNVAVAFVEFARPLLSLVATNRKLSLVLAAIRDALLPKLLSGEIRIKDAAKAVGEAV